MTLLVEKGTFTKTTSTGVPVDQTVTLSNGSLTPKFVILWTGGQTTSDGTFRDDNRWSYGFSDGTNDACQAMRLDESAEIESYSFHDNAAIVIINLTTNAIVSQGDISQMNAGNFHINWSVQSNTEALHIHYLVAGGTDITNVSVVNTTVGSTTTGNKSYNGSGTTFTPDFALTMTGADSYATANTLVNSTDVGLICIGAAKSTSKEWVMWGREETVATSDCDMYMNPDACVSACSITDGTITFLGDFVSFDNAAGGGITINVSNASEASTKKLAFLLIKGGQWDCGSFTSRSGTGTEDVALPTDFDPQLVWLSGIHTSSSATVVASDYLCMGASDGTNEGAVYGGNTNGLGTYAAVNSNTHSKVYRIGIPNATPGSSTVSAECDMNDMATKGKFQLNWTTQDGTGRRMMYWALGPALERIEKSSILKYNMLQRVGSALSFDGSNDQVTCGSHTDLWTSTNITKFSVAFWVYPTIMGDADTRYYVEHNSGVTGGFRIDTEASVNNRISVVIKTAGGAPFAQSNGVFTTNKWNHIIATYDNSLGSANLKIYVDNTVGAITGDVTDTLNNSGGLELGGGSNDIQGYMKDFRFWKNTVLDSTQRSNVMNNSTAAPTPDYWLKMQEGTGTPVDFIAGKTTTLDNGTTWSTRTAPGWTGKESFLKWHLQARASLSRIYKYNIIGRISLSRIYKWNIEQALERISKSSILKWNIIGRISLDRIYKWNINARASLARIYKYNIQSRVSLARAYLWNLQSRVSLSRSYLYNVIGRVSLSRIYKYNLQARVSLSSILKYNIQSRISLSRTYLYNILGRVSLSRIYRFNIIARTSLSRIYKWDLQARASLSRVYKWNMIGRISLARTYLWNVIAGDLERISKSQIYKWNLIGRISLSRIYLYNMNARISLTRIYRYNVLARVSLQQIYKYHIQARASLSRIYKYNIQSRVSLSRIYKWDILTSLERVSKSQIYKWNVFNRVSASSILKWSIQILTAVRTVSITGRTESRKEPSKPFDSWRDYFYRPNKALQKKKSRFTRG